MSPSSEDWDRLTKSIKKIVGPTMLFISLPDYDFRSGHILISHKLILLPVTFP